MGTMAYRNRFLKLLEMVKFICRFFTPCILFLCWDRNYYNNQLIWLACFEKSFKSNKNFELHSGNIQGIQELIRNQRINTANVEGKTALYFAAEHGKYFSCY